MKSKVYFSKTITPEKVSQLYDMVGVKLEGRVAIKVHSGEEGNQNFLKPEFWEPVITKVGGTVCECNTAYDGKRDTTEKHTELIHEHGWDRFFDFDLLDAQEPDIELKIENGNVLTKDFVGKNSAKYNSMLVLSHFKGHPMGGYGGALKQLSIGFASSRGKAYIHSAGRTTDRFNLWNDLPPQNDFLESMADAAKAVTELFGNRIVYINVMKNMSVDCDCCAVAEDPCIEDIGILASSDPVAIDRACIDLVKKAVNDKGQKHFLERVTSRNGEHTIEAAEKIGVGKQDYELIEID